MFNFRIDLSAELDSNDIMMAEESISESGKMVLLTKVKSQRQQLDLRMSQLKDEENVQHFNQLDIETHLKNNFNDKEFTKYKKLMNKHENIINLIFSLEIRLNEKNICNSKEGLVMLRYQMKNAKEALDQHEKNLEQFQVFLNARFNSQFCDTFMTWLNKKNHNLCLRRALIRELYFIHLKFDIVNIM